MPDYIEISDAEFESQVIKSDIPVVVDFWAPWCGPCRFVGPIMEEIATEYKGKMKVCKVNVDDHKEWAMKYGISSIPTMLVFKDGKKVEESIGAMPKPDIEKLFKPYLNED